MGDLNISSFCLHHGQGNGCYEGHEGHEEEKGHEGYESNGCYESNEGHEEEESDESHEGNGCYEGHEGHEEEKGHEGYESHEEVKIEGFAEKGTQLLQEGQAALVSDHIEQQKQAKDSGFRVRISTFVS